MPRGADEPAILAAWRARIVERLLEARERLLDPTRVVERELGVLHVPDPAAFDLPPATDLDELLPARERLVGQLVLYALLEATLADGAA